MKEHPDYKYRPRRKPKPLLKKDPGAKFSLPLHHFFPPGFDPTAAAFARHFFQPLVAAAATSSGDSGGSIYSLPSLTTTAAKTTTANNILSGLTVLPSPSAATDQRRRSDEEEKDPVTPETTGRKQDSHGATVCSEDTSFSGRLIWQFNI